MYDDDDGGTIGLDNLQSVRKDIGQDPVFEIDPYTGFKVYTGGITDEELKLMLKIGDPGPDEKYGGKDVDFLQFMHIMEIANLIKPENLVANAVQINGTVVPSLQNNPDDLANI